ncbi:MAG TPA: extracellular solute-binding protein [Thermoanaerobaculia bacterium]|nr:extracellular solute-binding protein [Thermoanaerobaculia bacterium]
MRTLRQRGPRIALLATLVPLLLGCSGGEAAEVVVYTSVDQVFSDPVFRSCGERRGLDVRAVFDTEETKSTGVLNRILAEASHPQADVFWSGDPVRPFVLAERGLLEPYLSPSAAAIPAAFRSADGLWTGLAARARVLLVNVELVPGDDGPASVRDLADPRWRGQAAIANPIYGTTTMHAAALFDAWGDVEAQRFFDSVRANDTRIAASNGEVKRLVASGEVAFGLTDTDDAQQALREGHPVRVVYPDQTDIGTLVMPTSVVLLRNGPNPAGGRRLVDCLLEEETERALAEDGTHMPIRAEVETPEGVLGVASVRAMDVDYAQVASTLERIQPWLRRWAGV